MQPLDISRKGGVTRWDPTLSSGDKGARASLYLATKPSRFGAAAWPPIGPDVPPYATQNPAQACYEANVLAGASIRPPAIHSREFRGVESLPATGTESDELRVSSTPRYRPGPV